LFCKINKKEMTKTIKTIQNKNKTSYTTIIKKEISVTLKKFKQEDLKTSANGRTDE